MSVTQEATEIERHSAHLSEVDGEPPYTIHGIAIGEGDVTRGSSGIEKKWPRDALKPAAETLAGRPLVTDHENDSHAVVGKVTEAFYQEGTGVLYEAQLFDEELAEKIANGLLEVSIRGFHGDVSEMEESEEGAKVVSKLKFDNLSIVPVGAAPSNTVEIGPSTEVSAAECAEVIGALEEDEVDEEKEVEENAEGAEDIRKGDVDRYEQDISRYPEKGNTPPEDSEGMHEYEEEEENSPDEDGDVAELVTAIHEPEFDEAEDKEWSKPALSEFISEMDVEADGWDDLTEEQRQNVADHFLVSKSGSFPPENYGELALPVVEVDGTLNLNALQNAKARAGQVEGVSSDDEDELNSKINNLAESNFDDADFGEEEEMQHYIDVFRSTRTAFEFADGRIVSTAGDEVEELRPAERTSSNYDADQEETAEEEAGEGSEPESNASEVSQQGENTMTEEDDNTVTIDKDELEELRSKADKADEREEELEELREGFSEDLAELKQRTSVLDEVDRDKVDELSEADDPMVIETSQWEDLEAHVDEVRQAYAAALSEHVGMGEDMLADKFSVDELREQLEEKAEEQDSEVEEELTPDPKSTDPDEEELEEAAGGSGDGEEAELSDEIAAKQEELRQKIGN